MPTKPAPTLPELAAHAVELLSTLGPVRVGRMFGGHGYYVDGVFIALSTDDELYLKADATTAPRFREAGCQPLTYGTKHQQRITLSYWSAPEDAMESPALMQPWARLAMEAALRARNAKPAARKRVAKQTATAARTETVSPPSAPPAPAKRAPAKPRAARRPAR